MSKKISPRLEAPRHPRQGRGYILPFSSLSGLREPREDKDINIK